MNIVRFLFTKYIYFCLIETCNRDFLRKKAKTITSSDDGAIGDLTTAISNGAIPLCGAVVVSLLCYRLIK